MIAKFYMRGGHTIVVENVKDVTMQREATSGGFAGYNIKWKNKALQPPMLSLSIPDIVAVSVEKTFFEKATSSS